jgi:hypothetical protein
MPANKKIIRRLLDIRTMSSCGQTGTIPYKVYMRLSMLEMEKYRRGKEKDKALALLTEIENRFKEIDEEIKKIFLSLGFREPADLSKLPKPSAAAAQGRSQRSSFKIKY